MSYLERRQQQQPPGQPPMLVGAVPPPPGVTANFINPEMAYPLRTGQTILGVGISIAGLFILMRIYTKARILRNFGAEDGAWSQSMRANGARADVKHSLHHPFICTNTSLTERRPWPASPRDSKLTPSLDLHRSLLHHLPKYAPPPPTTRGA